MINAQKFTEKLQAGQTCLGTCIGLSDPQVAEALGSKVDFLWIDLEHSALEFESVKCHLMALKGSDCAALVRVPWNDLVPIKRVLDIGADGIIVPMIRTAEDVRLAVSASRYPPEGIRGFGPLRPSDYGRIGAQEFCQHSNDSIITIVQIENADAVRNIDEILTVPGLSSIAFGPNDLANSMGYRGQPGHPEVVKTMEKGIGRAQQAGIPVGISTGSNVDELCAWVDRGIQWLATSGDVMLMVEALIRVTSEVSKHALETKGV